MPDAQNTGKTRNLSRSAPKIQKPVHKENPFNNRNHVSRCRKGGCFIEACNPIPRTAFTLKSDCTVIASTESTLNRPASAPEPCFSPAHSKESGSISSLNRITSSRSTRFPRSFFPGLSQLVHLLFGKLWLLYWVLLLLLLYWELLRELWEGCSGDTRQALIWSADLWSFYLV